MTDIKDISDLYRADPEGFSESLGRLLDSARSWRHDLEEEEQDRTLDELWERAKGIGEQDSILDLVIGVGRRMGVVGEDRAIKLLYLAATSRLLDRPVSLVIKGPSSAGKSYVVERTLSLFPNDAY